MNLPPGCSEQDIDNQFGDDVLDEYNSSYCETCGELKPIHELKMVCPDDGCYVCYGCLSQEE